MAKRLHFESGALLNTELYRNKFKYESKGFIAPLGTTKQVKNNTHNITVEHYTIILWIMQQFFLFFFQMGVGWGWVGWVWVGWIIDLRLLLPIQLIPILLLIQQGHATTKIFNCIRNVVVMGQMLFLDSMEKNNFQLADAYPICTFSSFCELVGYFIFIGSYIISLSWQLVKVKPAGMILPAGETKNFCQLGKLYQLVKCKVAASWQAYGGCGITVSCNDFQHAWRGWPSTRRNKM